MKSIIDPNALVGFDYQTQHLLTIEGNVLSGLVLEENESTLKYVTNVRTFTALRALPLEFLLYGASAGLAALAANWLGKRWLKKMSGRRFQQLAVAVMVLSGLAMLWRQRETMARVWWTVAR